MPPTTPDALLPFNDPKYIADPYPYWQRLRDEHPAHWSDEYRFWAITRYDDVIAVLHDTTRFSSKLLSRYVIIKSPISRNLTASSTSGYSLTRVFAMGEPVVARLKSLPPNR